MKKDAHGSVFCLRAVIVSIAWSCSPTRGGRGGCLGAAAHLAGVEVVHVYDLHLQLEGQAHGRGFIGRNHAVVMPFDDLLERVIGRDRPALASLDQFLGGLGGIQCCLHGPLEQREITVGPG